MGLGARSVVNFSRGSLCAWRSPLDYLGYTLEWSLVLEHVCVGGGNVTFQCIYSSRGNPLSLMSVIYLWATLGCGVFSCHGILVWPIRGSLGAPFMKSVAHRAVCAEFSSSSDVKS